jgi:hypothetical protein
LLRRLEGNRRSTFTMVMNDNRSPNGWRGQRNHDVPSPDQDELVVPLGGL